MRAAVYAGTRNVYQDMIPSMRSLLVHSNVDKIYFLIEDDEFPYKLLLPPEVECINVSGQEWFKQETCPNMKNRCSYMVLLRVVFSKLFPDLDRILTIDNDTIVKQDISELWDLDLTDYYIAGCPEYEKSNDEFTYINMGVAMINLKKWREDHMDDLLLYNLNTYYYLEAEQSCINQGCQGGILVLPSAYNANFYTIENANTSDTKIQHFAYTQKWQQFPIVNKYRSIDVEPKTYNLEIIIPHYNNIEGLKHTLKSIYYTSLMPQLHITVVDDHSSEETMTQLMEIKEKFPLIDIVIAYKNKGPGAARQLGIDWTKSAYVMFIDAGDYIKSAHCLRSILTEIKNNADAYLLQWGWHDEETNKTYNCDNWSLHGTVFNREFLELYHIDFPTDPKCSYCGEDLSFMQLCYINMTQIKSDERLSHYYGNANCIYVRTYDKSSIMHTNPHKKIIAGIVYNYEYIVKCCKQNNIFPPYVSRYVTNFMVQLYVEYLKCARESPDLLEYNMKILKEFYQKVYRTYEKINTKVLQEAYSKRMPQLTKLTSVSVPSINIHRFIGELKSD